VSEDQTASTESLALAAVSGVSLLSFWFIGVDTSTERWSSFLLIISALVTILANSVFGFRLPWKYVPSAEARGIGLVLAAAVPLGVAALVALKNWDSLRQESVSAFAYYLGFGLPLTLICFFGLLLRAPSGWTSQFSTLRSLSLLATYFLAFSAVLVSRTGRELFGLFREEPFAVLVCGGFLSFFLGTIFWGGGKTCVNQQWRKKLSSKILLFSLAALSLILSVRGDSTASIPGAHFHWAYFVGPVKTLRSGGTLLWDTPIQYGLGPAILPSMLPFQDATIAFAVFQSLIMTITSISVLVMVYLWCHRSGQFLALSILFISVFFFADPSLIGPHPYPSSSAVRFGPSVVLLTLLVIAARRRYEVRKILLPIIGFVAALSFLYSAESSIYTLGILAAVSGGVIALSLPQISRLRILLRLWVSFGSTVLMGALLSGVFVFLRTGNFPDFKMQYDAAFGYASGFGAVSVQVATPAWLVPLVMAAALGQVLLIRRNMVATTGDAPIALWASLGALVGWSTYWVGRAVNDNIVALFPLICLVAIVVTLASARNNQGIASKNVLGVQFPASVAIVVLLTLSVFVTTVAVVKSPKPEVTSLFSAMDESNLHTGREMWSPELVEAMESLSDEQRGLPIAYEGFMGMIPESGPSLSLETWGYDQVWIPSPLALLEEPIPESRRREIMARFGTNAPPQGLFIWDKNNSFVDRAASWFSLLAETHQCVVVFDSPSFKILECKALT
jgi:hypothetical protein